MTQAGTARQHLRGPQLADSGPLHPGSDFQGLEEEFPRVRPTGLTSLGSLPMSGPEGTERCLEESGEFLTSLLGDNAPHRKSVGQARNQSLRNLQLAEKAEHGLA